MGSPRSSGGIVCTGSGSTSTERESGKKFGDPANPLLVSCCSGAKFWMPGMMDTVLNIRLNDQTAQGMIALTSDAHFVYDAYRRLVQMFGPVVMGVADEPFEEVLTDFRARRGVKSNSDLSAEDLKAVKDELKKIVKVQTGREFPADPMAQLKLAIEAVFKSWNGKCAVDYRNAAKIPHDLGTAVNIVTMVFGNIDSRCAISHSPPPSAAPPRAGTTVIPLPS